MLTFISYILFQIPCLVSEVTTHQCLVDMLRTNYYILYFTWQFAESHWSTASALVPDLNKKCLSIRKDSFIYIFFLSRKFSAMIVHYGMNYSIRSGNARFHYFQRHLYYIPAAPIRYRYDSGILALQNTKKGKICTYTR